MNGGLDCEACKEAFGKEDTPCDECQKPSHIHPENVLPWKVWKICNNFERSFSFGGIEPIKATSIITILKEYNGSERDFEKVLWIEQKLYPELEKKRGK